MRWNERTNETTEESNLKTGRRDRLVDAAGAEWGGSDCLAVTLDDVFFLFICKVDLTVI